MEGMDLAAGGVTVAHDLAAVVGAGSDGAAASGAAEGLDVPFGSRCGMETPEAPPYVFAPVFLTAFTLLPAPTGVLRKDQPF